MEKILPKTLYHVYNRANGIEKLFLEDNDYEYFLKKFKQYLGFNTNVYSYCLMPNHFHFLLEFTVDPVEKSYSQQFSNFFNSYSKSFNQKYSRKGNLFMHRFKRKSVEKPDYLLNLICYIHCNPVSHQYVNKIENWKYSSYNAFISNKPTSIKIDHVYDWFGGRESFFKMHREFLNGELKHSFIE